MDNFEKIDSSKFNKLNESEMIKISGGKWKTEFTTKAWVEVTCPYAEKCFEAVTSQHQQHYNIFGKPTGDWQIIPDA
ncbi:MAG: hypothetical protein M0P32_06825 [Bacteroidales bacterium]|nr:hypothetical protein [Bacteroidales bacterium]MDD2636866.1 hypothetical protein [Bacteroidales bacterium]MDY0144018.1 hypothetical protein [Bacteroidales bacterium]